MGQLNDDMYKGLRLNGYEGALPDMWRAFKDNTGLEGTTDFLEFYKGHGYDNPQDFWDAVANEPPVVVNPATNLQAITSAYDTINLTWTAAIAGTNPILGYVVLRDGVNIGNIDGTSYTNNNLEPDTLYEYQVVTIDSIGSIGPASNSASDTTDSFLIFPPENVTATALTFDSVEITFDPAPPGSLPNNGYQLFEDGVAIQFIESGFVHTGLTAETEYQYRVRSRDSESNFSGQSTPAAVVTTPAETVTDLTCRAAFTNNVQEFVSVPSTPLNSTFTTGIDIQTKVSYDDWANIENDHWIAKLDIPGGTSAYSLNGSQGNLRLMLSPDGAVLEQGIATVPIPVLAPGETAWLRATYEYAQSAISFYTSSDGITWVLLGVPVNIVLASITDLVTMPAFVGTINLGTLASPPCSVYEAYVKDGIDGPTLVSFIAGENPNSNPTHVAGETGDTWTWNNTSVECGTPVAADCHAVFNAVAASYIHAPFTGAPASLDVRAKFAPADWTAAATVVSRWVFDTNEKVFLLEIKSGGDLSVTLGDGAAATVTATSTVPVPFTPAQIGWVRCTWSLSAQEVTFFTSTDGVAWTPLGTVVPAVLAQLSTQPAEFAIGGANGGNSVGLIGDFYEAQLLASINGNVIASFNAGDNPAGDPTHVAPTGETYTWTGITNVCD